MTIYLAGNLITNIAETGAGHFQLVRNGMEIEVQAPPDIIFGYWTFPGERPLTLPDGASVGDPNTYSSAAVTLGPGISEDGVWSIFLQANQNLSQYILPYDVYFNSNSFANTLLNVVGHSASEFATMPALVTSYPGMSANAATMPYGVEWNIIGSPDSDTLKGGWGNDIFEGSGGVDFIDGGAGGDQLYAGLAAFEADGSADYLTGGAGQDRFYVGNLNGPNVANYDPAVGDYVFNTSIRGTLDVIRDHSQFDKIYVTLSGVSWAGLLNTEISPDSLSGTGTYIDGKAVYSMNAGNTVVNAVRDTYFDDNIQEEITVLIFYEAETYTPLFALQINGESGGPAARLSSSIIEGTNGDDLLIGTSSDDLIVGNDGNDEATDGQGEDIISGGAGDDLIYRAEDSDFDTIDGGDGLDTLQVTSSLNAIVDLTSGQVSSAGTATDAFSNVEAFITGGGNDAFYDGSSGRYYDGGEGSDTVHFALNSSEYRIRASGNGYLVERAYLGQDVEAASRYLFLKSIETVTFGGQLAVIGDVLVETFDGTGGDDIISGTAQSDVIVGGNGNDTISAGSGSDVLNGGAGSDTMIGGMGHDIYSVDDIGDVIAENPSEGTDTVQSSIDFSVVALSNVENITLVGGAAIDATGNGANNVLIGNSAANVLDGGDGDDVLIGGFGNDNYRGGSGSDVYRYRLGDGVDVVEDWGDSTSTDVLEVGDGITPGSVSVNRGDTDFWDMKLSFADGGSITVKAGFIGSGTVIEEVRFVSGLTWTAADIRAMYLDQQATSGNDYVHGFIDASDTIAGRGGNDELYGYSGNDTLNGNNGDDVLFGNEGADTLIGEAGDDFMVGGEGADVFALLSQNSGTDWIDDFVAGHDKIDLSAISAFADFADVLAIAEEWGGTTWLNFNQSGSVRLQGVTLASLSTSDFIFA